MCVGADVVSVMAPYSDLVCTLVILAKHWQWLPDDGSCMNRNMFERLLISLIGFLAIKFLFIWVY